MSAAIKAGASEADAVLNRTYLQPLSDDGVNGVSQLLPDYISIFKELCVLRATAPPPTTLKLILETSQLSESEVVAASILAHYAGFDFIKTSSGFCGRGATIEDVRLMKRVAAAAAKKAGDRDPMQIKAAGGVKSFEDLKEMVAAGASRIGASAGVAIAEEAKGGKAAVGNSGGY